MINEDFRALTTDDILQTYISDHEFKIDLGYNFFVFVVRYQETFTATQPFKLKFKFDGDVPYDIKCIV